MWLADITMHSHPGQHLFWFFFEVWPKTRTNLSPPPFPCQPHLEFGNNHTNPPSKADSHNNRPLRHRKDGSQTQQIDHSLHHTNARNPVPHTNILSLHQSHSQTQTSLAPFPAHTRRPCPRRILLPSLRGRRR